MKMNAKNLIVLFALSFSLCAFFLHGCKREENPETRLQSDAGSSLETNENNVNDRFGGRLPFQDREEICRRADEGDASYQLLIGETLFNTARTHDEKAEAVEWFRKAAERDHTIAKKWLGRCYFEGSGVEQDYEKAFKWLQIAVNEGFSADAQYLLALCYIEGKGTKQDIEAGIRILLKLAADGESDAAQKLNELGVELRDLTFQEWVIVSMPNAKQLYDRAVEGDEEAQLKWATKLFENARTRSEKAVPVEWIRKAAEHEDYAPAHYSLGMCYDKGNGVERDEFEAFKWFQKGAESGHSLSQYQLALCYIEGKGTEQNKEAGLEILRKLSEMGLEEAKAKLSELSVSREQ